MSSRGIKIEKNFLVRIFRLQIKHLRHYQIGYVIVDGRSEEDDPVFKKTGVDVKSPLPSAILLHYHRDKGHLFSPSSAGSLLSLIILIRALSSINLKILLCNIFCLRFALMPSFSRYFFAFS